MSDEPVESRDLATSDPRILAATQKLHEVIHNPQCDCQYGQWAYAPWAIAVLEAAGWSKLLAVVEAAPKEHFKMPTTYADSVCCCGDVWPCPLGAALETLDTTHVGSTGVAATEEGLGE